MDEQLQRDIAHLLSQLESLHDGRNSSQGRPAAAAEEGTLPLHEQQAQQPPIIVYLMDAPPAAGETDDDGYDQDTYADIVESLPETEEEEQRKTAAAAAPLTQAERPPTTLSPRQQKRSRVRPLVVLSCVLFLLGALLVTSLVLPLLLVSATVTIIPLSRQITTTTTVSIVTDGKADPHEQQVPGRVLSSLTLTQARTVSTTGRGYQPATVAHGSITFYNSSLAVQDVPAGTIISGTDGVVIVTDQDAIIPAAANLSTNGQVTVLAHAVQVGPAGNMRAGDIYGACCRLDVSAANSTFTGGQNARSFPMVTRADLNGAVAALTMGLMQSVQAALAAQVHADETLVTPTCTPTVTTSSAVGDEAAHLSVTVDETCRGEVYRTQALHDLVTQAVTEAATEQVGTAGYSLSGNVQSTVVQSSASKGHRQGSGLTLRVRGVGIWMYQFTNEQLSHLAQRIAGKSIKEAKAMVLGVPGVQSVTIQLSGGGNGTTLPRDPGQIRMGELMGFGL